MNIVPKFKGIVENGRFFPYEQESYDIYVQSLNGKECELSVSKWHKSRSELQNKYYFGVVVRMVADEAGWTRDYAHSFMATMFLKEYGELKGKSYVVVRSTTSLRTKEFSEYVEECKRWASIELGLYIPDAEKININ